MMTTLLKQMENQTIDSNRVENKFKRFFSSLKEANKKEVYAFVTGVFPLRLNEFTSGWNHAKTISDDWSYAEMYGFTEDDVRKGLKMIEPQLSDEVQTSLMEHCKIYNGYAFHYRQKSRLFNPCRIMYFLDSVRNRWVQAASKSLQGEDLVKFLLKFPEDIQTRPAGTTLEFIPKSEVLQSLLQDLLKENNAKVSCDGGVHPLFRLEDLKNDRKSLISFM